MVQKLWHKMQRRPKRVGPYCRSQFSTLFLLLSGCTMQFHYWCSLLQNFLNIWAEFQYFFAMQIKTLCCQPLQLSKTPVHTSIFLSEAKYYSCNIKSIYQLQSFLEFSSNVCQKHLQMMVKNSKQDAS